MTAKYLYIQILVGRYIRPLTPLGHLRHDLRYRQLSWDRGWIRIPLLKDAMAYAFLQQRVLEVMDCHMSTYVRWWTHSQGCYRSLGRVRHYGDVRRPSSWRHAWNNLLWGLKAHLPYSAFYWRRERREKRCPQCLLDCRIMPGPLAMSKYLRQLTLTKNPDTGPGPCVST